MPKYPRTPHPSIGRTFTKKLVTSLVLTTLASTVGVAREMEQKPRITILIQNHTRASHTVLAGAERTATRIFERAGVQVSWVECPVEPSAVNAQAQCQKASNDNNVQLHLVSAHVKGDSRSCVWGSASYPNVARVYYADVTSFAVEYQLGMASVLGFVIAHEIGHVLLGPNSHYGIGIMRPQWSFEQVRQGLMGVLCFTHEQSERIRAEVTRRVCLRRSW